MAVRTAATPPDVGLGVAVIRVALGATLAVHGVNKVVGPGGLAGTGRYFEGLGLRPGWLHSRVAASTEVGVGSLLALGLATPAAAAGVVGLMVTAAATDHRGKGFFVFKGGWEYVALIGTVASALAVGGPGRLSLDRRLGLERAGLGWGAAAVAGGVAAAAAVLATRADPPAAPAAGDPPPTDEEKGA